mmetsp:Transcript_114031/g.303117  ORF Transcript_114031/g.303117 Transcript_114031/m.303117 type:complete len:241 (+) Transcript_114031:546-1268(+)
MAQDRRLCNLEEVLVVPIDAMENGKEAREIPRPEALELPDDVVHHLHELGRVDEARGGVRRSAARGDPLQQQAQVRRRQAIPVRREEGVVLRAGPEPADLAGKVPLRTLRLAERPRGPGAAPSRLARRAGCSAAGVRAQGAPCRTPQGPSTWAPAPRSCSADPHGHAAPGMAPKIQAREHVCCLAVRCLICAPGPSAAGGRAEMRREPGAGQPPRKGGTQLQLREACHLSAARWPTATWG